MGMRSPIRAVALAWVLAGTAWAAELKEGAQPPPPSGNQPPRGGFDGPGGGPPGMSGPDQEIVKQFDKDGDKRLDKEERKAARAWLKENKPQRGPGRMGGGRPFGPPGSDRREPPKAGITIKPADVKPSGVSSLYAPEVVRTVFLDFENDDWAAEMADFYNTDVELPATMTVDGEVFPEVGVHFRGKSSFMMIPEGRKRSLNVSLDFVHKKQRLDGYRTLNLLNGNGDPSMMSTVLYSQIARTYIPAPKANFVRVVINGENWGVFANVQQFNKEFLQENFQTGKGARWKVPGSPNGQGGFEYLGNDVEEYRKRYEIKTDDDPEDWEALIELCKALNETPIDKLEEALKPLVDFDSLLWFLALDCTLMNSDGYWVRASDFTFYRDEDGKFHFIPGDMNEAFTTMHGPPGGRRGGGERPDGDHGPSSGRRGGPDSLERPAGPPEGSPPPSAGEAPGPPSFGPPGGFPRMPRVDGVKLDPLIGLNDTKKPLRSRVLAVPSLRERYLRNVRTIAEEWLDWAKLGPVVAKYRAALEPFIAEETRSLASFEEFKRVTADAPGTDGGEAAPGTRAGHMTLRAFADQRRKYLLELPSIQELKK